MNFSIFCLGKWSLYKMHYDRILKKNHRLISEILPNNYPYPLNCKIMNLAGFSYF